MVDPDGHGGDGRPAGVDALRGLGVAVVELAFHRAAEQVHDEEHRLVAVAAKGGPEIGVAGLDLLARAQRDQGIADHGLVLVHGVHPLQAQDDNRTCAAAGCAGAGTTASRQVAAISDHVRVITDFLGDDLGVGGHALELKEPAVDEDVLDVEGIQPRHGGFPQLLASAAGEVAEDGAGAEVGIHGRQDADEQEFSAGLDEVGEALLDGLVHGIPGDDGERQSSAREEVVTAEIGESSGQASAGCGGEQATSQQGQSGGGGQEQSRGVASVFAGAHQFVVEADLEVGNPLGAGEPGVLVNKFGEMPLDAIERAQFAGRADGGVVVVDVAGGAGARRIRAAGEDVVVPPFHAQGKIGEVAGPGILGGQRRKIGGASARQLKHRGRCAHQTQLFEGDEAVDGILRRGVVLRPVHAEVVVVIGTQEEAGTQALAGLDEVAVHRWSGRVVHHRHIGAQVAHPCDELLRVVGNLLEIALLVILDAAPAGEDTAGLAGGLELRPGLGRLPVGCRGGRDGAVFVLEESRPASFFAADAHRVGMIVPATEPLVDAHQFVVELHGDDGAAAGGLVTGEARNDLVVPRLGLFKEERMGVGDGAGAEVLAVGILGEKLRVVLT